MTKSNLFAIWIFLNTCSICFGQSEFEYNESSLPVSKDRTKIEYFAVKLRYLFDNSDLLLVGQSQKRYQRGLGVIQYDQSQQKIKFIDIIDVGADYIKPHFFRTIDSKNPVLILCNIGKNNSFGVVIYSFENNSLIKLGFINVSLNSIGADDPVPFAKITTDNKTIRISFSKSVATNWYNKNMKVYHPGEISYIIENNKIKIQNK
jgi:hypothetical protein